MITLADAVLGDQDAIPALCAELDGFYGDTTQGTPAERAAQVRDVLFGNPPLAFALLAWDGNTLIGFAAYSFLWPAACLTSSLYLKELYVAEAYRHQGVGGRLMNGLYKIAAQRGCSRVEWTTDQDNTGAQAFYEALGVKPYPSKILYRASGDQLMGRAS